MLQTFACRLYAIGRLPRYAKSVQDYLCQPSTADSLLWLKREIEYLPTFDLFDCIILCQTLKINFILVFICYNIWLTFRIPEIDVFLSRLSHGTCYKWIHCDREKCFDKMFFWLNNGIWWFFAVIDSSQALPTINQLMDKNKPSKFSFWNFFQRLTLTETCVNICPGKYHARFECYLKLD